MESNKLEQEQNYIISRYYNEPSGILWEEISVTMTFRNLGIRCIISSYYGYEPKYEIEQSTEEVFLEHLTKNNSSIYITWSGICGFLSFNNETIHFSNEFQITKEDYDKWLKDSNYRVKNMTEKTSSAFEIFSEPYKKIISKYQNSKNIKFIEFVNYILCK